MTAGLALVSGESNSSTSGAMLMEMTAAEFLTAQDCSLYTVGHLEERHYSFGFRRGSPYARLFSRHLLELAETGRISRARDVWWPQQADCSPGQSRTRSASSLDVAVMSPAFIFLGLALLLSCIVALLEITMTARGRKISSVPSYLKKRLTFTSTSPRQLEKAEIEVAHTATQTVLWASSRAATPAPGRNYDYLFLFPKKSNL